MSGTLAMPWRRCRDQPSGLAPPEKRQDSVNLRELDATERFDVCVKRLLVRIVADRRIVRDELRPPQGSEHSLPATRAGRSHIATAWPGLEQLRLGVPGSGVLQALSRHRSVPARFR